MLRIIVVLGITVALTLLAPSSHAQTMTEKDFVGEWQCDSLLHGSVLKQGKFAEGWKVDDTGLTVSLRSKLTFDSGGGAFTVTSTAPNPVDIYSAEPFQSPYVVKNGQLLAFTYFQGGTNYFYEIRQVSETQMSLYPVAGGLFPVLMCERIGSTSSTSASTTTSAETATPTALNGQGKSGKTK